MITMVITWWPNGRAGLLTKPGPGQVRVLLLSCEWLLVLSR